MCGIVGIYKKNIDKVIRENVTRKMISSLSHRGPDGWGYYLDNEMALGHSRLSILDLNHGHQPMMSDRYVISYNGEVFNYLELKKELEKQGIQFQTTSDTEVVLKSLEVYSLDAFQKFNGQFAMIICIVRQLSCPVDDN